MREDATQASPFDDVEAAALLRLVARGDRDALAHLYDRAASRIYAHFLALRPDVLGAEQATRDTFLDIWKHAARFSDTRQSAAAWIDTLVVRRAV